MTAALLLGALSQKEQAEINAGIEDLLEAETFGNKPSSEIETWNLFQYIHICRILGLISDNTLKQSELAKDFRNLIHPGRAIRLGQECNRSSALSAVAGIEHVIQDLNNAA